MLKDETSKLKLVVIKSFTYVSILVSTGCVTTPSSIIKEIINPTTGQERYNQKIDAWVADKTESLFLHLKKGAPLYSEENIVTIPFGQLNNFYTKTKRFRSKMDSEFENDKNNMMKNRSVVNQVNSTTDAFIKTKSYLDSAFHLYIKDFNEQPVSHNSVYMHGYCEENGIPKTSCSSGGGIRRDRHIASFMVRRGLFEKHPHYREYYDWLIAEADHFKSLSNKITNYSTGYEKTIYLDRVKPICPHAIRTQSVEDTALYHSLNYSGFRPDKEVVYDLSSLKVLQSVNDGILLTSNINFPGSYSNSIIFVKTTGDYVDDYVFQPGEEKVCLSGTKEYTTALLTNKKVYSFNMITTDDTGYYFIRRKP